MTKYLTGTRDGERKRGENTNTNTPSPRRANPERARKKKRTEDGLNTNQRRGGRTEALDTTYKARATPTSAREGPKPDLTRARETHEIGDPWGASQ